MNGFPPPMPAAAWTEHQAPDGRTYYHNKILGQTTWTKPEDLMTPAERALSSQPWKEYTAEGGRKYWYNTETKVSSWEMPDAYRQALGIPPETSAPVPQTPQTPHGGYGSQNYDQYRDSRDVQPESRQIAYSTDPKAQAFVPASNDPEYATVEEAEGAFEKLLKRSGVQPDWTWEQTIRAVAKDPQWRAVKDPKDRRTLFERYCEETVIQDKERAKERMAKLQADFETMLKRHPEITHYTRWKTARPMIEGETIFRSTDNESERRQLFEDYLVGLKRSHAAKQSTMRKSAMDGLIDLLPTLKLEPYTRWHDAEDAIKATGAFKGDEKYQTLTRFDMLTAFQNHMKALERDFNDSKQQEKNNQYRKERRERDEFKSYLSELRKKGSINAGTKWSQILPILERDERYLKMAGHGGSTAQELFWDMIEDEERALRGPRNAVLDVLEDKRYDVNKSQVEDFLNLMREDRRTANIERDVLNIIFSRLREKHSTRHPHEDDKQLDRHQRRAVDDLRSHMKRLDPPIAISDTYDSVRSRLAKSSEFQAVASEDARRTAFEKHIRRLREKEEDAQLRDRHRGRHSVDRDLHRRGGRVRDRSRGERSLRNQPRAAGAGAAAGRSRSPEVDAYEADRRKAIAERERNHRKTSMAEGLLSEWGVGGSGGRLTPPRRDDRGRGGRERERDRDSDRVSDRGGRDRDGDRPRRSRRDDDGFYEHERRDREEERERQYRRRTDRGSLDELPYGDEHPSAGPRRRREDDEDDYTRRDSREPKRPRRDRSPPRSPLAAPPPPAQGTREKQSKKSPAPLPKDVHSGSEEGEIEEED